MRIGDSIEFLLMPGVPMTVLAIEPCPQNPPRGGPHESYKVVDPEGREDWVCEHDVRRVG